MKQPLGVGTAQNVQSQLTNTMADILHDQQRIVEKDLLGLALADIVLFDTRREAKVGCGQARFYALTVSPLAKVRY